MTCSLLLQMLYTLRQLSYAICDLLLQILNKLQWHSSGLECCFVTARNAFHRLTIGLGIWRAHPQQAQVW